MAIQRRATKEGFSYVVLLRDGDGHWYPTKTFKIKGEARDYENELHLLNKKGGKARTLSWRDRTFDDYWLEWGKLCRAKVSEGWKISQNQMYRDHVKPKLGNKKLVEVSKKDILANILYCAEKGLGPQMQRHVFSMLHKMFADAIEVFEYLESSPVRLNMKPEVPKVLRNFLKPDDAYKFLDKVAGDPIGPAIWIMAYCGLRIGEMQALQWWNIDLKSGTLTVTQQWKSKVKKFGPTKNGKPIRIPMPAPLVDYLEGKRPLNVNPTAWVVPSVEDKELMLAYDTFEDALKRLCKTHGVIELSPHELRHTCTELWVEQGSSIEDLRRILNHSSDSSTKGYMHETEEKSTRAARAWGKARHLRLVKKDEA
jgi:integrase